MRELNHPWNRGRFKKSRAENSRAGNPKAKAHAYYVPDAETVKAFDLNPEAQKRREVKILTRAEISLIEADLIRRHQIGCR